MQERLDYMNAKILIILSIMTILFSCSPSKPYYVKYKDLHKERFELFRNYVITDCSDTIRLKLLK